jgi:UDP-N-acetyl-D-mannosaminuronic acid dehydrogenase
MPEFVKNKIDGIVGGLNGKTVAVYGATYKPNIDDVRESPIMHLIDMLKTAGATVRVCEPHAADKLENCFAMYDAPKDADILVLGVNHDEFKDVDFKKLVAEMKTPNVLDTRNFWCEKAVTEAGGTYYLLGRGVE